MIVMMLNMELAKIAHGGVKLHFCGGGIKNTNVQGDHGQILLASKGLVSNFLGHVVCGMYSLASTCLNVLG